MDIMPRDHCRVVARHKRGLHPGESVKKIAKPTNCAPAFWSAAVVPCRFGFLRNVAVKSRLRLCLLIQNQPCGAKWGSFHPCEQLSKKANKLISQSAIPSATAPNTARIAISLCSNHAISKHYSQKPIFLEFFT
jgi:hypothetical protein